MFHWTNTPRRMEGEIEAIPHIGILYKQLRRKRETYYIMDIAVALQQNRNNVTIYTTECSEDSLAEFQKMKVQIPIAVCGEWIPKSLFGRCKELFSTLKIFWIVVKLICLPPAPKPKVLIINRESQILFKVHFLSPYKIIYIHHFPPVKNSDMHHANMKFTVDLLTAKAINYSDEVIVESCCIEEIFVKSFPRLETKCTVLSPCYETGIWLDETIDIRRILSDLPDDFILFVAFGQYKKRSNFKLLLDGIEQLFLSAKDAMKEKVHVVIAGRCRRISIDQILHYNDLIKSVKKRPYSSQITFFKQLPTVHKKTLIAACTAVIHTTKHDLYPGPILAAMSLAKPIIAVNSGFASKVLTHKISGILIEPDASKLAIELCKIATSVTLQTFLGNMALNTFKNQYCFDQFSKKITDLLLKYTDAKLNRSF